MSSQRVNRVLCASQLRGSARAAEELLKVAEERQADAVTLIGDLTEPPHGFREVFLALARSSQPVYWVPGSADAPAALYVREAHNIEIAAPQLHGVHGTVAVAPDGGVVFAGMGGEISDDPDSPREEEAHLRYPRWEAAYRLKLLDALDYNELVMLFATPPEHKGRRRPGSEAIAELVGTYRPRLVVCGGEPLIELLGTSLVVAPGDLVAGQYAVADLTQKTAEPAELAVQLR